LSPLLLDTHVLIWWFEGGEQLSGETRNVLADPDTPVFVSAASLWEVSIKRAKGRLDAPEDLSSWVRKEAFIELPISFEQAEAAGSLPPHHADPFDRILVAQARLKGLTIVTRDPAFEPYGVPLLAA
jgi:PIN domain nuclease of toxin-antitoxin system